MLNRGTIFLAAVSAAALAIVSSERLVAAPPNAASPLTMVVMDPLAAPLACDCVKGYAQRDYLKLAKHIEGRLGRSVKVEFAESLTDALKTKTGGRADLIIGKQSVVVAQSRDNQIEVDHIAALTGKDGQTIQTGLFVVVADDPALTVADLKGYRILFGPADADEKHAAALELLETLSVAAPAERETCVACSDGATKILELHQKGERAATVISSYAKPLLEGCGTIKKGDLRVVGETEPVPFVAAFVNRRLPSTERQIVAKALFEVAREKALCEALETKLGFVVPASAKKK